MKIPLSSVIGPTLKRNYHFLQHFCNHPFLGLSDIYTFILGMLGVAFSVFDLAMILKCPGPGLPAYLLRGRANFNKLIEPRLERDLKIIALVLSFEYYFMLVLGAMSKNPVLFIPFLFLYLFIIVMELLTLILRAFSDGFCFSKSSIFSSMFVIYNWLCVFCSFWHKLGFCDY